jgi:hypothetical protein
VADNESSVPCTKCPRRIAYFVITVENPTREARKKDKAGFQKDINTKTSNVQAADML